MLQHPFKVMFTLMFLCALCWVSAFVIMSTKPCCICHSWRFVPELRTSFNRFYCENCFKEID